MQKLHEDFKEQAEFFVVYIKEAHPEDEWQMSINERQGVVFRQPKTYKERQKIANLMIEKFKMKVPTLVDKMDDHVEACYAAWPERYYVIGKDGKVAYKGKPGPGGFRPKKFRSYLSERYRVQSQAGETE